MTDAERKAFRVIKGLLVQAIKVIDTACGWGDAQPVTIGASDSVAGIMSPVVETVTEVKP